MVIKRLLDITVSVVTLVIMSPVIVVAALLIRYKIGSPVLFRQQRPGLHCKPFYLYKFRSMKNQYDEFGVLLPDKQRITSLGHLLRKLSIDELPQLWNVLIGEMSIVGPRPLLMKYLPLYNSRQSLRQSVLPGITGWAQVNGRNSISWEEKFDYDVWYVENHSLWVDTKILFLTLKKVFLSEEIDQPNTVGMEDFMGTSLFDNYSNKKDAKETIERRWMVNILITSAGRRVKVIQYFKDEVNSTNGSIITTDMDSNAPALYFSDFDYLVPAITDDNYISELVRICEKHQVSAVLSLIDPELVILAAHKKCFIEKNIQLIISEVEVVEMCFDKYSAFQFFQQNNLEAVPTFSSKEKIMEQVSNGAIEFPLIAKPRKGSASEGITLVKDEVELQHVNNQSENLLFQPYFKDKEYGVDAYVDLLTGELVDLFIKEKLRMRSGETDKSISVHNERIEELIIKLIKKSNFKGPIDIDVFEYKGKYYLSEINPRFGGGYPHAYECGVNFPKYILKNLQGEANQPYSGFSYAKGEVMMKHDEIVMRRSKAVTFESR